MTILVGLSKYAVAEEGVDARERFGGGEHCGAGRDAVERERGLRGGRERRLREGMRERLEGGIVFEREVRAFVGFDEDEDGSCVVERRGIFRRSSSLPQRDPVRRGEAVRVALPGGERGAVVEFSCHGEAENGKAILCHRGTEAQRNTEGELNC
jgi:hypothetical protein